MPEKRLVWDLPLRLFHWLLVLCICGSYATAKAGFNWTQFHFWIGYVTLALVVFRIIWGFVVRAMRASAALSPALRAHLPICARCSSVIHRPPWGTTHWADW